MSNFFDDIPSEGQELFDEGEQEETDTSAASSADETSEEEVEEETDADQDKETEEQIPFNKHPRFQQIIKENRELREEIDEIRAWKEQLQIERESAEDEEDVPVPEWFYGDEQAWKRYQQDWQEREERLLSKVEQRKQQQLQAETETKQHWETWVDDQLDEIEATYGKVDRNKLMAIVEKYKPTDMEGNLDFNAGYELMQKMDTKKSSTTVKKTIADISGSSKATDNESFQGVVRVF